MASCYTVTLLSAVYVSGHPPAPHVTIHQVSHFPYRWSVSFRLFTPTLVLSPWPCLWPLCFSFPMYPVGLAPRSMLVVTEQVRCIPATWTVRTVTTRPCCCLFAALATLLRVQRALTVLSSLSYCSPFVIDIVCYDMCSIISSMFFVAF